jgi:hypothetical protein
MARRSSSFSSTIDTTNHYRSPVTAKQGPSAHAEYLRLQNEALSQQVREAELRKQLEAARNPAPAPTPTPAPMPTPAVRPAPLPTDGASSGGSSGGGGGGGSMSAAELLKAYQEGVASSGTQQPSGRSLDELRAISDLDAERMREEQNLQLQGQKEVLDQTRQARAAEKEQDFQYETRRRQREASNAMAAYRGL